MASGGAAAAAAAAVRAGVSADAAAAAAGADMETETEAGAKSAQSLSDDPAQAAKELATFVRPKPGEIINWDLAQSMYSSVKVDNFYAKYLWPELCQSFSILRDKKRSGRDLYAYESIYHVQNEILALIEVRKRFQPKKIDKKIKDELISILTYACKYWMESADKLLMNWSPSQQRNYGELLHSYQEMIPSYEYLRPRFFKMIKRLGRSDHRTRFQLVPSTIVAISIYLGAAVYRWKLNNYVYQNNTTFEQRLVALRTELLEDRQIVTFATTHKTGDNEKGESQDFKNEHQLKQSLERHYESLIQQKATQYPYLPGVLRKITLESRRYPVKKYEVGASALILEKRLNTNTQQEITLVLNNLKPIIDKRSPGLQPTNQPQVLSTLDSDLSTLFNCFNICLSNPSIIDLDNVLVLIKAFKHIEYLYFNQPLPLNWLIKGQLSLFMSSLNRLLIEKAIEKFVEVTAPAFCSVTGTPRNDGLTPISDWKATEDDWQKAKAYLYELGLAPKDQKIASNTNRIEPSITNLLKTLKVVIYHPNDFSSKEVMMAINLIKNYKVEIEATHIPHAPLKEYLDLYLKTLNRICLQKMRMEECSKTPPSFLNNYTFNQGTVDGSYTDSDKIEHNPNVALINAARLKDSELRKRNVERITKQNHELYKSPVGSIQLEQAFRDFSQYHTPNIVGTTDNSANSYYRFMEGIYVLRACASVFGDKSTSIVTLFSSSSIFISYVSHVINIRHHLLSTNQLTHDLLTEEDDSLKDLYTISDFTLKVLSVVASSDEATPFEGREQSILSTLTNTVQSYIQLDSFYQQLTTSKLGDNPEDVKKYYLLRLQCQKYAQAYLNLIHSLQLNKKFSSTPIEDPSLLQQCQSEISTRIKNLRLLANTYKLDHDSLDKQIPQEVTDMLSGFRALTDKLSGTLEAAECAAGAGGAAAAAAAAGNDADVALRRARQRIKTLKELKDALEAVSADDKANIKELKQQLERSQADLVKLREQIDQLQLGGERSADRNRNQAAEIKRLTKKIETLSSANDKLSEDLLAQKRAATGHQRRAREATADLKVKNTDIERLEAQLAAAQETIRAKQEALSALRKGTAAQLAAAKAEAEQRAEDEVAQLTASLDAMTLGSTKLREQSEAQAAMAAASEADAAAREQALIKKLALRDAELLAIYGTGEEDDCSVDFKAISQKPSKPMANILSTLAQQEQTFGAAGIKLTPQKCDSALLERIKTLVRTLDQPDKSGPRGSISPGAAAAGADVASRQTELPLKHRTYIDGGYPRCHLAGVRHNDIDLITTRSVEWMKLRERNGKVTIAGFNFMQNKNLPHLWTDYDNKIDLVCNPNLNLAFEANQRDLTCNALFVMLNELNEWVLIDPTGCGITDINDKILSVIGDIKKRMSEDPSRILRLLRFHIELGWDLTPEQSDMVRGFSTRLNQVPYGVFASNMRKIFKHPHALQKPDLMNNLGNIMGCTTVLNNIETMRYLIDVLNNPTKYKDGNHKFIHAIGLLLSIETLNQSVFTPSEIVDNFLRRWSQDNLNDHDRAQEMQKLTGFVNYYMRKFEDFQAQEAAYAQHQAQAEQFAAALQQATATQHAQTLAQHPQHPPFMPSFAAAAAASAAQAPFTGLPQNPAPGAPPPRHFEPHRR